MLWPVTRSAKTIKTASRLCFVFGYPLPIALRSRYILDVYSRAASNYVPDIYPGRVIVFKPAEDSVNPQVWESLAAGGLEVHEVSGSHTGALSKEAHVREWAELLRTYLQSAQSAVSRYDTEGMISATQPIKHENQKLTGKISALLAGLVVNDIPELVWMSAQEGWVYPFIQLT